MKVFTEDCLGCTSGADACDVCKFENTMPDGSCAGMMGERLKNRKMYDLRIQFKLNTALLSTVRVFVCVSQA